MGIKAIVLAMTLVVGTGCVPGAGPSADGGTSTYRPIAVAGTVATPAERATCDSAGGRIQRGGFLGHEICVQRYPDAGRSCGDRDECLGRCLNIAGPNEPPTGQCQATDNPFGCFSEVYAGGQTGGICVD